MNDEGIVGEHREHLVRERRGHAAFARTRRRAYVENRGTLDQLDRYLDDATQTKPLVVTGASGTGKSALLAHWAARVVLDRPDATVITHHVGAGTFGSELSALLRHLMLEITEHFDVGERITDDPTELADQFLSWTPYLRGRTTVVIIDGINQIVRHDSVTALLCWIPDPLTADLRIVLSTIHDAPVAEAAREHGCREIVVEPLDESARREVARRFIGGEGAIPRENRSVAVRIARDRRSANPLFLRTSLEELRYVEPSVGRETSTSRFLEAEDLPTLFERVLERIEGEFGRRLVSTCFRMIDASRNGLSSEELADLAGVQRERVERFLATLDYQLLRRNGLYSFFHEHFRSAVRQRYAATNQSRKGALRRLGSYFRTRPIGDRRADEEPAAWRDAGRLDELAITLAEPALLDYLRRNGRVGDSIGYWRLLGEAGETVEGVYVDHLSGLTPSFLIRYCNSIGDLALDLSDYPAAEGMYRRGLEVCPERSSDAVATIDDGSAPDDRTRECIHLQLGLGIVLRARAMFDEAEETLDRLIGGLDRTDGVSALHGRTLDTLASVHYYRNDFSRALVLHERAHSILRSRNGDDHVDSIEAEMNVLACLQGLRQTGRAEEGYRSLIDRCEQSLGPDHVKLADIYHNYAMLQEDLGNHDRMGEYLERALAIVTRLFGDDHVRVASELVALSVVDRKLGEYERAEERIRRSLAICESRVGVDHPLYATTLGRLAVLCNELGRSEEAEQYQRKVLEIRIARHGDDHSFTHRTRLNVGNALLKQDRLADALPFFRRSALVMCRRFGPENPWSLKWKDRYLSIARSLGETEEAAEIESEWQALLDETSRA